MQLLGLRQKIANQIIRPPRLEYSLRELGSKRFELGHKDYEREDFQVGRRGLTMECCLYRERFRISPRPTVVYLHANSSTRLSVYFSPHRSNPYLRHLLPHFDVVAFDFPACGLSSGHYVTLGYSEQDSVHSVIEQLHSRYGARPIMIWGRSMGAVTGILYAAKHQVQALVLDSPFSDFTELFQQLANKDYPLIPNFLLHTIFKDIESYVNAEIKKTYQLDFYLGKLKPVEVMSLVRAPVFFIGSVDDKLVHHNHLTQLYQNTTSFKELQLLQGGHNQMRPDHLKTTIVEFLNTSLVIGSQKHQQKQHHRIKRMFSILHEENNQQQKIKRRKRQISQ